MSNVAYLCRGARACSFVESQMLVLKAFAIACPGRRQDLGDFASLESVPIRPVVGFLGEAGTRTPSAYLTAESAHWQPLERRGA